MHGAFKISRRQKLSEFYTPRKFSSPQVMSCAAKSHVALLADERVENTVLKFNRVARKLKELIQTAGTAQNGSDLLRANSDLSVTRKF